MAIEMNIELQYTGEEEHRAAKKFDRDKVMVAARKGVGRHCWLEKVEAEMKNFLQQADFE